MTISFIYNGKTYTTNNLEKKLLRMGLTESDIIIPKKEKTKELQPAIEEGYKKYHWRNVNPNSKEYNYTICGITKKDIPDFPENLNLIKDDWILEIM